LFRSDVGSAGAGFDLGKDGEYGRSFMSLPSPPFEALHLTNLAARFFQPTAD